MSGCRRMLDLGGLGFLLEHNADPVNNLAVADRTDWFGELSQ